MNPKPSAPRTADADRSGCGCTCPVIRSEQGRAPDGACWRYPEGPGSDAMGLAEHPALHVTWTDALAFARWAGKRLPTEAEREAAARGDQTQASYPWGEDLVPSGVHQCNIWQGAFPRDNTDDDGFLGTAPAASFAPSSLGLHNVVDNVWDWTVDGWRTDSHAGASEATRANPLGPPSAPASGDMKVIRGGSYLCHATYCNHYRLSARSFNSVVSIAGHMGFRCCV